MDTEDTYEIEVYLRNGLVRSFRVRMLKQEELELSNQLAEDPDVREYHFWPDLGDMNAEDFKEEFGYWKDSEL